MKVRYMFLFMLCAALSMNFSHFNNKETSAKEAMDKLKEGNLRFVNETSRHEGIDKGTRKNTALNGQHPYATVVACSDSRVPVEQIFDAGIGEIFVIRIAGNVVSTNEAGSIEYGIGHLHTPVLVILGHTSCGAVTAVAKGAEVHGNIPQLMSNIEPAVAKAKKEHGDSFNEEMLLASIKNNIWQSIEDLYNKSEEAKTLVKENKLSVVGAIYHLDSGEVEWLGQHPEQKKLVK